MEQGALSTPGITVVRLTGAENWSLWKFQTRIVLNGMGLFGVVNGTDIKDKDKPAEWDTKDAKAQTQIVSRVSENVMQHLLGCKSASDMWTKLSSIYELKSSCSVHLVQEKFMRYKYEGGGIASFFSKIEEFVNQLNQLDEKISDKMIITKVLMALPPQYRHFVSAWESVPKDDQTLNDLQARLLIEEERMKEYEEPVALAATNSLKCFKCGETGHKQYQCRQNKKCAYCKRIGHLIEQCYFKKAKNSEVKDNNTNKSYKKTSDRKSGNAFISSALFGLDLVTSDKWIVDSGASDHMTFEKSNFSSFSETSSDRSVMVGDGRSLKVQGMGQVYLKAFDGHQYIETIINNVLYVPDLKMNLFSVTCAVNNGYSMTISGDKCEFIKDNVVCAVGKLHDKFYVMNFLMFDIQANVVSSKCTLQQWHEKLAHQNFDYCRKILKDNNIDFYDSKDSCVACLEGKSHKLPFSQSNSTTSFCGEVIHADLCGPIEVPSVGGSKYMLVVKDDYSLFRKVYFMEHKSDVPDKIIEFITFAESDTGNKVKILRTDNGTEFVNRKLDSFLISKGIHHQKSIAYTPEQNGKVEREMRTIMEAARTMLIQANLDKKLWAEAANTAVYIMNRTYCKNKYTEKTPHDCWYNKTFDIRQLHKFGSEVICHIPKEKRAKLDPKAKKGIFVGYGEDTKGLRIYFEEEDRVDIKRDIVFIKHTDTLEHKTQDMTNIQELFNDNVLETNQSEENMEQNDGNILNDENLEYASAESLSDENLPDCTTDNTERTDPEEERPRNLRPRNTLKKPDWHKDYSEDYTCFISYENGEPKSYKEAMEGEESSLWETAMQKEMDSLTENDTWELVPKPDDSKIIESKWVFKRKQDEQGNVTQYKARLVARGFQQTDFLDEDFYSPVAKLQTLRTFLAVCNKKKFKVHQMDVNSAFLHGDIKDRLPEIYMCPKIVLL